MREAIKLSAVWFYQVLARRVGYEPMQKWIAKVDYGNQKIGNKDDIDKSCQLSTVNCQLLRYFCGSASGCCVSCGR